MAGAPPRPYRRLELPALRLSRPAPAARSAGDPHRLSRGWFAAARVRCLAEACRDRRQRAGETRDVCDRVDPCGATARRQTGDMWDARKAGTSAVATPA